MTFAVRINGEEVWHTDLQVEMVSLQSANGEAGRVGVSYDTSVIDLVVSEVTAGGPLRLDHVEALERQQLAANREGHVAAALTADRYDAPDSMRGTQGDATYTATDEGTPGDAHLPPAQVEVSTQTSETKPSEDVAGDTSGADTTAPNPQSGSNEGTASSTPSESGTEVPTPTPPTFGK